MRVVTRECLPLLGEGAPELYRWFCSCLEGSLIRDAPTRKTIEWTNSVSTRGASVCSGGGPFARSLCLVSLCEYGRVSTQTFRECFLLLDTPSVSTRFFRECFRLFESD